VRALAAYRDLLKNRQLSRLLGGEFVSGIGDWLYIVGILVVIYRESNDAAVVGLFGAARVVPYVVLSIPAGFVADRFDRRLVLLVTDLLRGACMLGMAWLVATDGPVMGIVALAILAACGSTFFYPAIGAYIPNLVTDERQLGPANSAWASLDNVGFIIGPVIGGLLVAFGDVTLAFVINAATFLVIAVVLWGLPPSSNVAAARREGEPSAGEAADGPAASAAAGPEPQRTAVRPIVGIALIEFAAGILNGGVGILTVILAIETLHAGEAATGYLNAAIGVGGVTGAVTSGVLVLRRRLAGPLIAGAIAMAIGVVVIGLLPVLVAALVGIAAVAAGALILNVITTTLLQRVTSDAIRGRSVGLVMTVATLAEAVGSFTLPVLVVAFGAAAVLGAAGAAMIGVTALSLALIGPALSRPRSAFEATIARIAELPLFVGVPAAPLEATLSRLRPRTVQAGEVIIRQGDPAELFYIIESGSFVVTQRGEDGSERVLRHIGADEIFGEIGLLRGSARTATVTAEADGVLLELDGADFLALVGGEGAVRTRFLGHFVNPTAPNR
jgi:MFS family permease